MGPQARWAQPVRTALPAGRVSRVLRPRSCGRASFPTAIPVPQHPIQVSSARLAHTYTGEYVITFDRNLDRCIALANALYATHLNATTWTSGGPTVTVGLETVSTGDPTDSEFSVAVFC